MGPGEEWLPFLTSPETGYLCRCCGRAHHIGHDEGCPVPDAVARIRELEAEVERERLRYGRAAAAKGVLMQYLADRARQGEDVRHVLDMCDKAARDVRLEDFAAAHTNSRTGSEEG